METSSAMLAGEILFYVALVVLLILLIIKKRKQTKDSNGIDYKNQPKDKENENN